jgi:hypothetical protein
MPTHFTTLREAGDKHNLLMGTAINAEWQANNKPYWEVVEREYSLLVDESGCKWERIQRQ